MKKLLTVFIAVSFALLFSVQAFAAGINTAEQSVLANMRTPADLNGKKVYVPDAYVNQAEAHFNTIDMTEEQADAINSNINAGRAFLEGTGKSSIKELSSSEKQTLLSYASAAAKVLDLVTPAGVDGDRVKIITADGDIVMDETEDIIKTTGFGDSSTVFISLGLGGILLLSSTALLITLRKRQRQYEKENH